jgi:hypothetical protein
MIKSAPLDSLVSDDESSHHQPPPTDHDHPVQIVSKNHTYTVARVASPQVKATFERARRTG